MSAGRVLQLWGIGGRSARRCAVVMQHIRCQGGSSEEQEVRFQERAPLAVIGVGLSTGNIQRCGLERRGRGLQTDPPEPSKSSERPQLEYGAPNVGPAQVSSC